jgi:hypothetical protein
MQIPDDDERSVHMTAVANLAELRPDKTEFLKAMNAT